MAEQGFRNMRLGLFVLIGTILLIVAMYLIGTKKKVVPIRPLRANTQTIENAFFCPTTKASPANEMFMIQINIKLILLILAGSNLFSSVLLLLLFSIIIQFHLSFQSSNIYYYNSKVLD